MLAWSSLRPQFAEGQGAALVEDGFAAAEADAFGGLEKDAGVNGIAPLHGLFASQLPVAGVVLLVLKLDHPILEEVVGVVQVEGNAGAEDVDQGKPLVFDGLSHQVGQMADIAAVAPGHKGCAVHDGRGDGIDGHLHAAKGSALGLHAVAAGGGNLAGGETVDLVVHDNVGEVDVAAGSMGKVVAADAVTVPVASGNDYREFVVGQLGAGGHCQGTPVEGVHAVAVEVARQV